MKPQIIQNDWRMSKILPTDWSENFAMNGEHKNERMKEVAYLNEEPMEGNDVDD